MYVDITRLRERLRVTLSIFFLAGCGEHFEYGERVRSGADLGNFMHGGAVLVNGRGSEELSDRFGGSAVTCATCE